MNGNQQENKRKLTKMVRKKPCDEEEKSEAIDQDGEEEIVR
jgi:hypothetical protein